MLDYSYTYLYPKFPKKNKKNKLQNMKNHVSNSIKIKFDRNLEIR